MYDQPQFIPQGWQCPVCKRVYSPDFPFCTVCGNTGTYTTTNIQVGSTPLDETPEGLIKWIYDYVEKRKKEG